MSKKTVEIRIDCEGLRMLIAAKAGRLSEVDMVLDSFSSRMPVAEAIERVVELAHLVKHLEALAAIEGASVAPDVVETAP